MKKLITVLVVLAVIGVIFAMIGPLYIIEEGEQAVVVQFGKIVKVETEAGLKFKLPFVDNVVKYSKKVLSWDGAAQRLPTAENQFIWVDTTARWKITDPKKFYESVGTINQAHSRLDDVIDSSVRKVVSTEPLREAVRNSNVINEIKRTDVFQDTAEEGEEEEISITVFTETVYEAINKGRNVLSDEMLEEAAKITPQYGLELIDIIIRQIKYSEDLTESVYNRMIKERNKIAQAFRSDGEGKKASWMGKMQKELDSITSGAYKKAEEKKGDADALAAAIYARAYRQDPEFYRFWKSIESYRTLLPKFRKTLTTEPDYFDYLYNPKGR